MPNIRIEFASERDTPELEKLIEEHDMGLIGEVIDYIVLREDGVVKATAGLVDIGNNTWHMPVFAAAVSSKGYGGTLLSHMLKLFNFGTITVVARGSAAGFYTKYGFIDCDMDEIDKSFDWVCDECGEKEKCAPKSMKYVSRC